MGFRSGAGETKKKEDRTQNETRKTPPRPPKAKRGSASKKKKENKEEETGFVLHGPMSARGCCVDGEKKKRNTPIKKKKKKLSLGTPALPLLCCFSSGAGSHCFAFGFVLFLLFCCCRRCFLSRFRFEIQFLRIDKADLPPPEPKKKMILSFIIFSVSLSSWADLPVFRFIFVFAFT